MSSKLQELQNKYKFNPETAKNANKTEENFKKSYTLENGLNKWRTVCFDDGSLIKEVLVHMNLGVPFVCPSAHDKSKKCPSCDFGWKLYNENGKKHTDESKNYLKQSKWVMRGIARAKEKEDMEKHGHPVLRFLDLSPTNGKSILDMNSPEKIEEFGDFTDLLAGRDLLLTKDEAKAKLRQASVTIERGGKDTPVLSLVKPSDPSFEDVVIKMFDTAIKLEDRFENKEPEEILELLEAHLSKIQKNSGQTKQEDESFSGEASEFSQATGSLADADATSIDDVLKRM